MVKSKAPSRTNEYLRRSVNFQVQYLQFRNCGARGETPKNMYVSIGSKKNKIPLTARFVGVIMRFMNAAVISLMVGRNDGAGHAQTLKETAKYKEKQICELHFDQRASRTFNARTHAHSTTFPRKGWAAEMPRCSRRYTAAIRAAFESEIGSTKCLPRIAFE